MNNEFSKKIIGVRVKCLSPYGEKGLILYLFVLQYFIHPVEFAVGDKVL